MSSSSSGSNTAGPSSFRSFWTAPQNAAQPSGHMYEYQGSNDHSHAHGHGDGDGRSHSHAHSNEDTPLLNQNNQEERINNRAFFGFPAAIIAAICILLFLFLLFAILYIFNPFGAASVIANNLLPTSSLTIAAVCNPFSLFPADIDWSNNHGIVAELYVLPLEKRDMAETIVDYEKLSVATNLTFFFSELNTPTRLFTDVFSYTRSDPNKDGDLLLPAEYFLLNMRTRLKLRPDDSLGPYEFALISDDASKLYFTSEHHTTKENLIVNNDNIHSTRMAVSSKSYTFPSTNTYINAHIQYVQGPPAHIALVALWRKWTDTSGQKQVTESADNDLYWKVDSYNKTAPSEPTEEYEKLLQDGWSVIPEELYYLPEHYRKKNAVIGLLVAGANPCTAM